MNAVLKVTILLGSAAAATLTYAGGQMPSKSDGDGGVREAIRFERAKDAADARQARIESGSPHVTSTQGAVAANQRPAGATTVGDGGVREAVRYEKAKDAADAMQARIEARHNSNAAGNADRSMTGHN